MKRELTCIVCPIGCQLTAEKKEGELYITGNACPRGKAYAQTECTAPMRTLTTTVRCRNGQILPVKTDRPIPKGALADAMQQICKIHPSLPIRLGDVIIKDIYGANLVATANGEEETNEK